MKFNNLCIVVLTMMSSVLVHAYDFPRGSYEDTSRNCTYDAATGWIRCECENDKEKFVKASINIPVIHQLYPETRKYEPILVNHNGVLKLKAGNKYYQYDE